MGDNHSTIENPKQVVSTTEPLNNLRQQMMLTPILMHVTPNLMHTDTPINNLVIREIQNLQIDTNNIISIPKEKEWIKNMFNAYSFNIITILSFSLGISFGLIITGGIIISETSQIIVYVVGISNAVINILILALIGKLHKKRNRVLPR